MMKRERASRSDVRMCRCATFDILPVSHFEPPDYGGSTEFFHYMCNLKHRYISLCHVADAMSPTTRLPSALITAAVRLTTERLEPAMHRDVHLARVERAPR